MFADFLIFKNTSFYRTQPLAASEISEFDKNKLHNMI